MARKSISRGLKGARTRARNKQLAALAADEAQLQQDAEDQRQNYADHCEELRLVEVRVDHSYKLGLRDGQTEGYKSGYMDGCAATQKQLLESAKNLNERRTELGSAASVVDSMSRVVEAGSQALTTYFADKRNGPNANTLKSIDDAIAGLPKAAPRSSTHRTDESNFGIKDLMSLIGLNG